MPEAISYLAVAALVALASSRRAPVARAALRWLAGDSRRGGSLRVRAVRSARRSGGTVAGVAALYGTAAAPEVTLPVLAALGSGSAAYGAYRARAWQKQRSHHRKWVRPAYMAARDIAAWPDGDHPAQGILWSTEEAREYALSGVVSPLPAGMPGAPVPAGGRGPVQAGVPAGTPGTDLVISQAGVAIVPGEVVCEVSPGTPAVTLREAVKAGVLGGLSLAAARKRVQRDPSFPSPVGRDGTADLYDVGALAEWASAGSN